ncbi:gluzincin family metallopeptidase [Robertkochia sediminum]|uniref:metalloprotease n=1 Tax=Robertkochia sediminum TaxID=2785326 RepID=UPI00293D4057|nr:metalloprotease [Robertkochia sediminum]
MLRSLRKIVSVLITLSGVCLSGQNSHRISAQLLTETHSIQIQQEIIFHNTSQDTLNEIWLYDWNHAYSTKNTPLAQRFDEEFKKEFHLAKTRERGRTHLKNIADRNYNFLHWERQNSGDLIRVQLQFPAYPGKYFLLRLNYTVDIPSSKFTGYGYTSNGNYNLRYWYITPALYHEEWKLYSNKDLNDNSQFHESIEVKFTYPGNYSPITDLDIIEKDRSRLYHTDVFYGENRGDVKLFLKKENDFEVFQNQHFSLISNIDAKDLSVISRVNSANRVIDFIDQHLGAYPHKTLLITKEDYADNPLYGLNQLPSFLRPFPEEFQYELKLLKTAVNNFLQNSLFIDQRAERWITDALQTWMLIEYKNTFYPDMKLLGNLSNTFLLRGLKLARMDFNEQYPFLQMLMARRNQDQSLLTPTDSLIKFNEKIAGKYKAGVGLSYLDSYMGGNHLHEGIREFYNTYKGTQTNGKALERTLNKHASKDISWFSEEFVNSDKRIDFKIRSFEKEEDSVRVFLKNKTGAEVPITLFGLDKEERIVFKQWINDVIDEKTVTVPGKDVNRLVLNYDHVIPEFNERDNWKSLGGFFSTNKKLKLQFFKDAEDPNYNQLFYVPALRYNIYDGLSPELRIHNKTFRDRPFIFDLSPGYALKEKSLVGGGNVVYRHYIQHGSLYVISAALSGSSFHYAENLRYSTITPYLNFGFRNKDLRSNERQFLTTRFVNVIRESSPLIDTDPDYSIFNTRYTYSNNGIIKFKSWFIDLQIAAEFSKISFNYEWRRLFQNNRQLNLRFFAGKFIYNETGSDYFSYALDRPTDYLFDYGYLGRSEESGFASQQIIIAEGGFKSQLPDPFSDDWIATINGSFNLWRWIEVYGDVGLLHNTNTNTRFVYDSGIRLNLVTDYFELYFPVYSNNGWEIAQDRYDQKIRFLITLSPRVLSGLFTRKWF